MVEPRQYSRPFETIDRRILRSTNARRVCARLRPMHRLTHRDLAGALQFLASCDVSGGLQQFAASVTRALPALISADVTVFAMADLCAPSMLAIENPRVT